MVEVVGRLAVDLLVDEPVALGPFDLALQAFEFLLTNNQNLASKEKQLERIDNLDAGKLNDLDAQLKNVDQILLNIEDSLTFVGEERDEAKEQLDEKNAEIERLEESLDAPAKPELSGRPDDGSTMEELQEQYDQIIEDDEAAAEEEWYPGR